MFKGRGMRVILVSVLVLLLAVGGFAQVKMMKMKKMAVKKAGCAAGYLKTLASGVTIGAGKEYRYITSGGKPFDVSRYNYLHIIVGRKAKSVANLEITVLLSVSVPAGALLIREYTNCENRTRNSFTVRLPSNYNKTAYVLRVPVIAPMLYDVIVKNRGTKDIDDVHVILFAK